MKDLSNLWDKPLIRCNRKGCSCQFAVKGTTNWSDCALDSCVKYKRKRRRYESNVKRPR